MDHFHHGFLIDPHQRAVGYSGRGAHAKGLCCEATFSEEIALLQNAYCGFLPALCKNGELYLPSLYVKNRIGRVALRKDCLLFVGAATIVLPPSMVERKVLRLNLLRFLAAATGVTTVGPLNI